jgi:hypothetical protein
VSDASVHHACFLVWEGRKRFVARFNRLARGLMAADGSYPHMTSEGALVQRRRNPPRPPPLT